MVVHHLRKHGKYSPSARGSHSHGSFLKRLQKLRTKLTRKPNLIPKVFEGIATRTEFKWTRHVVRSVDFGVKGNRVSFLTSLVFRALFFCRLPSSEKADKRIVYIP